MENNVMNVQRISKNYQIKDPKSGNRILFWALQDVSFGVSRGECVGLLGANGSGKSTLLKIISHIVTPTSGTVHVQGSLAPLLDLGAGFHDELTGRENIYVYASLIGIRRREIRRKFDEIVDFSGVADFLETKVRSYSSGMKMRLAFSIASSLKPDVILADEILAVGDEEFKEQCLHRILSLKAEGTAILIVQHDEKLLSRICDRTIQLCQGKLNSF